MMTGRIITPSVSEPATIDVPNLKILTSGKTPDNPYEILDAARLIPLISHLRNQFDAIVIDSAPVLRTGDALKLSLTAPPAGELELADLELLPSEETG